MDDELKTLGVGAASGILAATAYEAWRRSTEKEIVMGRPARLAKVDPASLAFDADTYQFKSGDVPLYDPIGKPSGFSDDAAGKAARSDHIAKVNAEMDARKASSGAFKALKKMGVPEYALEVHPDGQVHIRADEKFPAFVEKQIKAAVKAGQLIADGSDKGTFFGMNPGWSDEARAASAEVRAAKYVPSQHPKSNMATAITTVTIKALPSVDGKTNPYTIEEAHFVGKGARGQREVGRVQNGTFATYDEAYAAMTKASDGAATAKPLSSWTDAEKFTTQPNGEKRASKEFIKALTAEAKALPKSDPTRSMKIEHAKIIAGTAWRADGSAYVPALKELTDKTLKDDQAKAFAQTKRGKRSKDNSNVERVRNLQSQAMAAKRKVFSEPKRQNKPQTTAVRDGSTVAWATNGKVEHESGLTKSEAMKRAAELRKQGYAPFVGAMDQALKDAHSERQKAIINRDFDAAGKKPDQAAAFAQGFDKRTPKPKRSEIPNWPRGHRELNGLRSSAPLMQPDQARAEAARLEGLAKQAQADLDRTKTGLTERLARTEAALKAGDRKSPDYPRRVDAWKGGKGRPMAKVDAEAHITMQRSEFAKRISEAEVKASQLATRASEVKSAIAAYEKAGGYPGWSDKAREASAEARAVSPAMAAQPHAITTKPPREGVVRYTPEEIAKGESRWVNRLRAIDGAPGRTDAELKAEYRQKMGIPPDVEASPVKPKSSKVGKVLGALGPLAVVGAGAVAFDATRSEAMAAGSSDQAANIKGGMAAAGAAGTVAAVGWGIGKGIQAAAKAAPAIGKFAARAVPAVALGFAGYEAVKGGIAGYKNDGSIAGALKGAGRGVADFATMGAYSHFDVKASGARLTPEQIAQFKAAEANHKAMKESAEQTKSTPKKRGFANPAVQKAAQEGRGVKNVSPWANDAAAAMQTAKR